MCIFKFLSDADHKELIALEHNGYAFTTVDRDNDGNDAFNCATYFGGGAGFWYGGDDCWQINLNYEPVQNMQYRGIGQVPYLHARMLMREHHTVSGYDHEHK